MRIAKRAAACLMAVVLIAALAGCGGAEADSDAADGKSGVSGTLMLYTSEPEELVSDLIAKFNETYPDVSIEIFRSGTGKVTAKMDAELETGSTPANIIWFADIGYMKNLDDKGMILHYTPENASGVDPQFLYGEGMGTEVRLIYNVIAYNTAEVTDAPTDWFDVTSSDYTGSFAIADPNYSGGSFTALVTHTQYPDLVGWDWYKAISDNDCKYEESNGNLTTKVSSGEYKAVEVVDFQARTAKAEGSPVEVCYPASGAVLVPTPICLMNNIPEESVEAAKTFVNWCLSEEAQKMFVAQQYIPVTDVEGPEGAPKSSEIKTLAFDLDYFVSHSAEVREQYTTQFGGAK